MAHRVRHAANVDKNGERRPRNIFVRFQTRLIRFILIFILAEYEEMINLSQW